jgi:hypothetical protein
MSSASDLTNGPGHIKDEREAGVAEVVSQHQPRAEEDLSFTITGSTGGAVGEEFHNEECVAPAAGPPIRLLLAPAKKYTPLRPLPPGEGACGIGAHKVALKGVPRRASAFDADAVAHVGGDDVARRGHGPTDDVVRCIQQYHAVSGVAKGSDPIDRYADVVSYSRRRLELRRSP